MIHSKVNFGAAILVLAFIGNPSVVEAQRRPVPRPVRPQVLTIVPDQDHYRGQNTLRIKQLIRRQRPRFDFAGKKLSSVVLVAKSRLGRATATLKIGRQSAATAIIPRGRNFDSALPRGFHHVSLSGDAARRNDGSQPWQVELRGNVRIQSITVTIGPDRGGRDLHVGTIRARGVRANTQIVRVEKPGVTAVKIEATRGALHIHSVTARFGNGRSRGLPALAGQTLRAGQQVAAHFLRREGRYVQDLEIVFAAAGRGRPIVRGGNAQVLVELSRPQPVPPRPRRPLR